jgi:molecular chaperone DnaJ
VIGFSKKISLDLKKACAHCKQTGAESSFDIVSCVHCEGRGFIDSIQRTILGNMRTQKICPYCQGQGRIIKKKCSLCKGSKFTNAREEISFNVPLGINPEKKLILRSKGNDGLLGGKRGDIYVTLKIEKDLYFKRKSNDIHVELEISFLDALLGNKVEIITIEGLEEISIPSGSQNGECLILRDKGCYTGINKKTRGDLIVWLKIRLPKKINPGTEEILRKLYEESTWRPNRDFIEKNKKLIDG